MVETIACYSQSYDHIGVQSEQVLLSLSLCHASLFFLEFQRFLYLLNCHFVRQKTDKECRYDAATDLHDIQHPKISQIIFSDPKESIDIVAQHLGSKNVAEIH